MMSQLGDLGSGAGKGGGGGGSIREAGGAFGKAEAAKEEEYFYKKVKQFPYSIYIINPVVYIRSHVKSKFLFFLSKESNWRN